MWKIEYQGTLKDAADWGIHGLSKQSLSLGLDVLSFNTSSDLDAENVFAPRSIVKLFRGDLKWFEGIVDQTPRSATGRYEQHSYVVAGPWWYLENCVYQQRWKVLSNPLDASSALVTNYRSHFVLGVSVDGLYMTTKAVITEALQFCIDSALEQGLPAPFQIGAINLPDFAAITRESTDWMCSEVIRWMLRYSPDAVSWFDYSTSPPTFNLSQRSALVKTSLEIRGLLAEIDIHPRNNLQVHSVVLKYERTNLIDGFAWPELIVDKAPADATGREFGAVVSTINLAGAVVNHSLSEIVCEAVNTASVDWWKSKVEMLADENVRNLSISGVVRVENPLSHELVSGTIAAWMLTNGKRAQREVITAKASYELVDETGAVLDERFNVAVDIEIITTNLTTGVYKTLESAENGEPAPIGLAAYLFASTNTLYYDGVLRFVEDEVSGLARPGFALNITGAKAEYETMNAIVQSVTENIDAGSTTVVIGPPKHLGKDDIMEFLQVHRQRIRLTPAAALSTGKTLMAAPVELGKQTAIKNTNTGLGEFNRFTVGKKVAIAKADNPKNLDVKLRELPICLNNVQHHVLVLSSPPYLKPPA